ncbi:MAG: hypothetical protein COW18_05580 [Zetaproteobacteria bacterium CG12_big_fil_rev_8_21_14_0_65_54_13]|nr:MAG: hypothetical protein COW18_05580 [Zetaproteobacteria bacterium CG12_big_fil_rev_8_21_14_0_65_54_13]PIX55175.1 MAG: hypothetical protein COZ50_04120 [Zetaproteobacteria bacterium CG_4_10_14_3_um_filter_54_28]PJA28482.1 MAG: hypothetical protein CO188_09435 [Zetaproteobacteria bacterium CG_4_9_14_3_um_filter_54_145]
MAWIFNRPLHTLTSEDQNNDAKHTWEHESLGGIAENNNPLPRPVIGLLILTYFTAMALTFPLYGQRPTAAIYADYVSLMNSSMVQEVMNDKSITHNEANSRAMAMIEDSLEHFDSPYTFQRAQHPIDLDQLRVVAPQIVELQHAGVDLEEYSVIGPDVIKANFFNILPDGTISAKQPWWDKGYTIAVWWFIFFCLAVIITVKRLPHFSWRPDHTIAH